MARGKKRKWKARLQARRDEWDNQKGDVPFPGVKIMQPTNTHYHKPGSQKK